jgi:hypothetical protein
MENAKYQATAFAAIKQKQDNNNGTEFGKSVIRDMA